MAGRDDVPITSGDLSLAATITRPVTGGRHPGVVVVHAAGMERREDYRAYADSLASRGIVVLTYDIRGRGGSEGSEPGFPTFQELSEDAQAAIRVLRAQPDVDPRKVGLWSLSRGSFTAPLTAVGDSTVRFLIVVSGPGLPAAVSDSSGFIETSIAAGLAPADVPRAEHFAGLVFRAGREGGPAYDVLRREYDRAKDQPWFPALQMPTLMPEEELVSFGRAWTFDPDSAWRRVRVPTLLIYGERDRPRLVLHSRARILSGLSAAGVHVDAPVYADADHFIRVPGPDGERRFAEGFFDDQQRWIADKVR